MSAGIRRERLGRALPKAPALATKVLPDDRLLDVYEAAAMLGLKSPRTLYKWAYSGRIPSVKIGRLLRFRRSDLERLIADGECPAFAPLNGLLLTASALAR